jgi:hypothetical protein
VISGIVDDAEEVRRHRPAFRCGPDDIADLVTAGTGGWTDRLTTRPGEAVS